MGRPKKADGSDINSSSSGSPQPIQQPLTDVDNVTNAHMTSPSSGPQGLERDDTPNTLKSSSVSEKIKQENDRPSCEYLKKMGEMCYQGEQNMSAWQQNGQVNCNNNMQSSSSQNNVASSEFIEEEMDEILMMLQNDNPNSREYQGAKKMRCFDNSAFMRQRNCKSEFSANSQGQWPMSDMSGQQANVPSPMNEPMNMSIGQMSAMSNRGPPPQYPGYTADFCQNGMQSSPCNSPMRQMHSPGSGYLSESSAQSPGYMSAGSPGYSSNTSPNHSPACQYSPEHSPVYHSLSSPQHSPYQTDCGSPHGSPYKEQIYPHSTFHNNQTGNFVHDLSVNITMAPISPSQASPIYNHNNNNNNHHHMMLQPKTNVTPMTIPTQEGGVTSYDGWCLAGSPSQYCHSPSQTNPQTIPHQERGYNHNRHTSSWHENLQRINNFFKKPSFDRQELTLIADDEMEGAVTRSDIEREVVCKTLASVSPKDSYFYVMTDHHSCSSDSNSNFEEFTSCRRINKRKNYDDTDMFDSQCYNGFQVGRYKRQLTEKYWQSTSLVNESLTMTADKQALLDHLLTSFKQMVNKYTDSVKPFGVQARHLTFLFFYFSPSNIKFAEHN